MSIFANYAPVVAQAFQSRGLTGQCPMCKQNQWILHNVPVTMPVYESSGEIKYPGTSMPMAAMICRNCGFAGFFSLGAIGLINAQPPATAEVAAPAGAPAAPPADVSAIAAETAAPAQTPKRRKRAPKAE